MSRQGMVVGLWILAAFNTALMLNAFLTHLQLTDFSAFYDSVADFWRMGDLYRPHHYINLNPPHVSVLLFTPLLAFDLRTAAIIWTLFSGVLVVFALWLLQSEWRLPRTRCELVLGVFGASIALNHCWREGQVGAVLLLLSSMTWVALRRGRASAPAWLALSASLKPWILVSLVGLGRRVAIVATGVGVLGLLLGVLMCGLDNWIRWSTEITATKDSWFRGSLNISMHGLIARSVSITGEAKQSVLIPAWIVLSLGLCTVTWLRQGTDVTRAWLLWLLVGILISPVSWTYYLLVLTGPLVAWGESRAWPALALTGIGLLVVPPWIVSSFPLQGWSIYSVGTLLVWWSVLRSSPTAIQ
jgi:hypothetical protein